MVVIKKVGFVFQVKVIKVEIDKNIERERKEKEGIDYVVKVINFFRGLFCIFVCIVSF